MTTKKGKGVKLNIDIYNSETSTITYSPNVLTPGRS
jgi:hypothetical protein